MLNSNYTYSAFNAATIETESPQPEALRRRGLVVKSVFAAQKSFYIFMFAKPLTVFNSPKI
jgi:hypothetical protein